MADVTVTPIADGMYLIEHDGKNQVVFIAGSMTDRWIFWNGKVFRGDFRIEAERTKSESREPGTRPDRSRREAGARPTSLTAPMPARVGKILAQPDSAVKKGDILIVLEAMKMELSVRAPADGKVVAVHCREGELVDAEAVLIDLK